MRVESFQRDHRRLIRTKELELVFPYLPPKARILEVGAGAGWQAKILADRGHEVVAIDLPNGRYSELREYPVADYDGDTFPLEAESVDVVFSSNVLEHVPNLERFFSEMSRVMKPGGLGLHIMPTPTWRLWTTLTLYPKRMQRMLERRKRRSGEDKGEKRSSNISPGSSKTPFHKLLPTHGVRGNGMTEMFFFSPYFWRRAFEGAGWSVVAEVPNGLLYSGNRIAGQRLPLEARRRLSGILGSSCRLYVVKKKETT